MLGLRLPPESQPPYSQSPSISSISLTFSSVHQHAEACQPCRRKPCMCRPVAKGGRESRRSLSVDFAHIGSGQSGPGFSLLGQPRMGAKVAKITRHNTSKGVLGTSPWADAMPPPHTQTHCGSATGDVHSAPEFAHNSGGAHNTKHLLKWILRQRFANGCKIVSQSSMHRALTHSTAQPSANPLNPPGS